MSVGSALKIGSLNLGEIERVAHRNSDIKVSKCNDCKAKYLSETSHCFKSCAEGYTPRFCLKVQGN